MSPIPKKPVRRKVRITREHPKWLPRDQDTQYTVRIEGNFVAYFFPNWREQGPKVMFVDRLQYDIATVELVLKGIKSFQKLLKKTKLEIFEGDSFPED